MANIICAISSIPFKCSHLPITLSNREYSHPIFALDQKQLFPLYKKYTAGELTDIDSYLLFLALLKSTDKVEFVVPAQITTSTPRIVANNISQLINVIWSSNAIYNPRFKQPRFFMRKDNCNLDNINIWIHAWRDNIEDFKSGLSAQEEREKLRHVEDKLSKIIFTPEAGNIRLAAACAEWACKAAGFPATKAESWKKIIRKCYSLEAMFSTSKQDLKEIKEFCEENIEAGSIHYRKLMQTLRTGIANHNDFLGLGTLSSSQDSLGYSIVPQDSTKEEETMLAIIAKAPRTEPKESDYPNKISYIRARLAYRQAQEYKVTHPELEDTNNEQN